jgi:hypothetical protein
MPGRGGTGTGGHEDSGRNRTVRVKISLALLFLLAAAGFIAVLARLQDAQQTALEATQSQRIAEARANEVRAWAKTVSDSLGQALTFADPPPSLALDDTTRGALAVRAALASAAHWYEQARRVRDAQLNLLDPSEEAGLKARGLADPARMLRESLIRRTDLIPFEGVLGGRMQFVPSGIAVLSPEWVYARFEDGHVGGSCLLAYDILPRGEIVWRRLAARQD